MAGRPAKELAAITAMREQYAAAEDLAHTTGGQDLFYPALNCMAAELIVDAGQPGWKGLARARIAEVRDSLDRKIARDPDFWAFVGLIELRLYDAIAHKRLAKVLDSIVKEYDELHARDGAGGWDSALDQLDFVLPKYISRASPPEKAAAAELRARFKAIVGR
jgi:hypothetical protein